MNYLKSNSKNTNWLDMAMEFNYLEKIMKDYSANMQDNGTEI